ncbi:MAG: hypothetical protein NZM04_01185 [Methylacidiphilales bacterium]|nr:hypothetical protein [Candidatus Methylacidiphilales bacterium]MDW8349778.1 hypothetical protein [Verrucomicrobiae bacterium]
MAYSYEPRSNPDPIDKSAPPPTYENTTQTLANYNPEFARPILSNPKDRKAAALLGLVLILIIIGICIYLVVDIRNALRAMQTLQNEYDLLKQARDRALLVEERLYGLIRDLSSLSEHNELALTVQEEFGIVIEGSEAHNRLNQTRTLNKIHGDFGGVDIVKADAPPQNPPPTPTPTNQAHPAHNTKTSDTTKESTPKSSPSTPRSTTKKSTQN